MSEHLGPTASPLPPPASAPPPPGPPPGPRRFRRSRSDRVLAGVCGGLAESLAMDPVIVRVLLVVLSFFGGAGLIVYLACWLLMPEDDRETSLAERAIARGGSNPWPALLLAGVLGLAAVLSLGWVVDDRGLLLIALFVITAVLLARRETPPTPPPGPGPAPGGFPAPAPGTTPGATPAAPPAASWDSPGATVGPSATGWAPTTPLPPLAPAPPPPPSAPQERSVLGRLTFCLVLLALGVLGTADLAGADVPAAAYPALVLAGAGVGLLIGTRYGRGRWLIALGVVGALALPPAVFVDAYRGDWVDQGERAIVPLSAAEIAPTYEYRGGRVRFDFTQVDFDGHAVTTHIEVGVGDLEVIVPENVDVVTDVDLGIGAAEIFDSENSGFGVSRSGRDDGADGPGGGLLTVEIEQGIGHVEVRRAAA